MRPLDFNQSWSKVCWSSLARNLLIILLMNFKRYINMAIIRVWLH